MIDCNEICPNCKSTDVFKNKDNKFICGDCLTRFDSSNNNENEKLNIFISYGHPENKICKMICDALKHRGHSVWFDEEKIKSGDNWRQKITEGILNSNGVVACLSEHSMREKGVCLDELSIAVGIKGCNINTILLDSENKVMPPASICHIQWLDMHDWKERFNEDEIEFHKWFEIKMQELFSILESEENKKFSGQIDLISQILDVYYDTSKQKELLNKRFVGRKWLTEEIEKWLNERNDSKFCVLYGDPGVGKSAFSAHYIHYNSRVAAGIFCDYRNSFYNNPKIIIQTLAYLLACRIPTYREILSNILLDKEVISKLNENELFEFLLLKPLSEAMIDGGRETMCIVIDGLDETGTVEHNALAETLSKYASRFPAWLKILVTSRKVSAVTAMLSNAKVIEIVSNDNNNIRDVEDFLKIKLSEKYNNIENYNVEIKKLSEKSNGIFLYANMLVEAIMQEKILMGKIENFPEGLNGIFSSWFGWFFENYQEYIDRFRLPLGMLISSEIPIPIGELRKIFEFDVNQVNDFLRKIEVLFRIDENVFKEKTIEISHKYFADWLDSSEAGKFRTSKLAAKEHMADKYYDIFLKDIDLLSRFEILNIGKLLKLTGKIEQYENVIKNDKLFYKIIKLADEYTELGKIKEAKECYSELIENFKYLEKYKSTENNKKKLAQALNYYGNLMRKQGNMQEAIEFYYDALKIKEEIIKENATPENIRELYVSYNQIGDILNAVGNINEAEENYEQANLTIKEVYEKTKLSEDQRLFAISYSQLADFYKKENNYEKANENLLYSNLLIEGIIKNDCNAKYKRDLAVNYVQFGLLHWEKDKKKVDEFFKKAHEIFEELYSENNAITKRDLAISYERLAYLCTKAEKTEISKEFFGNANKYFGELIDEFNKPEYLRDLAFCNLLQTEHAINNNEIEEALQLQYKSHGLIEKLNLQRGTAEDKRDLAVSYGMLGYIYSYNDKNNSLENLKKSRELFEDLVRERGIAKDKRDLEIIINQIENIKNNKKIDNYLLWTKKIKRRCWYLK